VTPRTDLEVEKKLQTSDPAGNRTPDVKYVVTLFAYNELRYGT